MPEPDPKTRFGRLQLKTLELAGLLALSWIVGFLLSFPFLDGGRLRLILAFPASGLLFTGVRTFMRGRRRNGRQEQYRTLLSYLIGQVSIGRSLEQAILSARAALGNLYPVWHPFNRALWQAERQIQSNQTASQAIGTLVGALDCPEATVGIGMLRRIHLSGATLQNYLRQAVQSLSDLMEITRDIAAQNARATAEAIILACMPFAMAILLGLSGQYLEPAKTHPAGKAILSTAFLVAVLALSLIPGIISPDTRQRREAAQNHQDRMPGRTMSRLSSRLKQILYRLPFISNRRRIDDALQRIHGEINRSAVLYDALKVRYLLAGTALGVLMSISLRIPWIFPVPPVILILLQDWTLFRQAEKEERRMLATFPYFLHVCVSLLEAGLTIHHVLSLVAGVFAVDENKSMRGPMAREARKISQSLRTGLAAEQILEQLALQSTTSELRASYQLLARYGRLGGTDLLQQLFQQTKSCWSLYRNAARASLDERSMQLMLPMMLDLIVILCVSITPAFLMMSNGL